MFHLDTYFMGLRPLSIFKLFQCGDYRLTYRRQNQILTPKVDPRAVRDNVTYSNGGLVTL